MSSWPNVVCLGLIVGLAAGLYGCGHTGFKVEVVGEKITFLDKVRFKYNRAEIMPESHPLLNEIVRVVKERPEIRGLLIAGHTDNTGPAAGNLQLSQARAEAVRAYLVAKGVSPGRLEARGYGERRPIASNHTPAGRERNRRVEFIIVKR